MRAITSTNIGDIGLTSVERLHRRISGICLLWSDYIDEHRGHRFDFRACSDYIDEHRGHRFDFCSILRVGEFGFTKMMYPKKYCLYVMNGFFLKSKG